MNSALEAMLLLKPGQIALAMIVAVLAPVRALQRTVRQFSASLSEAVSLDFYAVKK